MNTQEAYEGIRSYFSQPGAKQAVDEDGMCMYRAPDGNKCAFGCILPDELYITQLEGRSVDDAFGNKNIDKYFEGTDLSFLQHAQKLHDGVAIDIDVFKDRIGIVPSDVIVKIEEDIEGQKYIRTISPGRSSSFGSDERVTQEEFIRSFLWALDRLAAAHGLTIPS